MKSAFFSLVFVFFALAPTGAGAHSLPIDDGADDYIQTWKDEAIYQMVVHGIPASITLAQGMLESGNGASRLAREGNNHFGIKCHTDWDGKKIYEDDETKGECFRKYRDACESFEDHSLFLKRTRYEKLFSYDTDDYKKWARGLKECGYATNPNYPKLLTDLIERYELHQYDREGMEYRKKGKIPSRTCAGDEVVVEEKKKEKPPREKQKDKGETSAEVTFTTSHQVLLSANRIKYVVAKEGDTPQSIAEDLDMMPWQIRKYNDLGADENPAAGSVVYLQPKRGRGTAESHTVREGDDLRSVSQQYGIKINRICKLNGLAAGSNLTAGQVLKLK
ncbi:MAG: glucosaminidase domain-containing protein [Flavobacteriales bacterium]|nr:glucosaminidase domain-containing protein [Flavobacteriales bacterium]